MITAEQLKDVVARVLFSRVGVFVLITQAHARFYLVHVLTTGTTRPNGVPTYACGVYIQFDGIVDKG